MNTEDLNHAYAVREEIKNIRNEIALWDKEINSAKDLAYLQTWNNSHATALRTSMDNHVFTCFRAAAIDNLQTKLKQAEAQFKNL